MENLSEGVTLITDNTEALACLAYHGQTAAMLEAEQFGLPRSFCGWQTDRAYYVAAHFQGCSDPIDNGYTVLSIAKDNHTRDEAEQMIAAFLDAGRDESGPCFFDYCRQEPASN